MPRTAEELQKSFDLRWDADQRAIKRWQDANPGSDLTWPDHADLVVWLLDDRNRIEQDLSQAYYLVTGKSPAWSDTFGRREALEEIKDTLTVLRKSIPPAQYWSDLTNGENRD